MNKSDLISKSSFRARHPNNLPSDVKRSRRQSPQNGAVYGDMKPIIPALPLLSWALKFWLELPYWLFNGESLNLYDSFFITPADETNQS